MGLGIVVACCSVSLSFSALSPFVAIDCTMSAGSIELILGMGSVGLNSFLADWFARGLLCLDSLVEWLEELLIWQ